MKKHCSSVSLRITENTDCRAGQTDSIFCLKNLENRMDSIKIMAPAHTRTEGLTKLSLPPSHLKCPFP